MVQQEVRDSLFIGTDSRDNFKNIIAKRSDLIQQDAGRLGASQYGQYLYAGTVLGLASSGPDSGFYKPYLVGATDGSQFAVGVLAFDANVGTAISPAPADGSEISIIREATLFQALLVGLDSGAIANLGGHSFVEHGVSMIRIRA